MTRSDKKEVSFAEQLTAVVLADSFDVRTRPVARTWGCVRVGAASLLDLTLDSLSRTQIANVILAAAHPSDVTAVVEHWRGCFEWIKVIDVSTCGSVGDVMRVLDARALLQADWILAHAGLICTDTLTDVVEQFRARRKKDKNCVMTVVYSGRRAEHNPVALQYSQQTGKLTHYTHVRGRRDYQAVTQSQPPLVTQLTDCQLAVCSPQIPPLFTDNFDFKTRGDLIREILANEDITGSLIHVHLLPDNAFAACITDYNELLSAARFMLYRFTYPCTPDALALTLATSAPNHLTYDHRFVYRPAIRAGTQPEQMARVARSARLQRGVVVSAGCSVGEGSSLHNVLLADNVTIGAGCTLRDCVVAAGVLIGDNVVLHESLLLDGAAIGSGCAIGPRCLLGAGTCLADGTQLSEAVLSSTAPNADDLDQCTALPYTNGVYRWSYRLQPGGVWPAPLPLSARFDQADQEDSDADSSDYDDQPDAGAVGNGDATDDGFTAEVFETIQRALADEQTAKNLLLELNGAKFAYNASNMLLITALVRSVLVLAQRQAAADDKTPLNTCVANVFNKISSVMSKYFESEESQSNGIAALEELSLESADILNSLVHIVHYMYEKDWLSENAILRWYDQLEDEEADTIQPKVSAFITWLKEAEEESSGEEESD